MISVNEVKACLAEITGLDETAFDGKQLIIENAISFVEKITVEITAENKPRAIMLAAARVNYCLSLSDGSGSVTSFKAGDVSFSCGADGFNNAKEFYENTLSENADLIKHNGFEFMTV